MQRPEESREERWQRQDQEFERFLQLLAWVPLGAVLMVAAMLLVALVVVGIAPPRAPNPSTSPEACLGSGGKLVTTGGKYNSVDCLGADGTRVKVFIEGGRRP